MLGNMFAQAHAGFGNQMQGAMDRMWDINQHNASRSGGGGFAPQRQTGAGYTLPEGFGTPNPLVQAKMEADANSIRSRAAANDFIWKARQPEFQGPLQAMFGFGGFGMGGQSPFGSLPTQFNTNYGAQGSVTNPTQQPSFSPYFR